MTCPDPVRLVAASAGADVAALAHAAGCPGCRRAMRDHLSLRDLAAELPAPTLRRARRDGMAAELLARAELVAVAKPLPAAVIVEPRFGRAVIAGAAIAGALAAAAAVMMWIEPPPPSLPVVAAPFEPAIEDVQPITAVVHVEAPVAPAPRADDGSDPGVIMGPVPGRPRAGSGSDRPDPATVTAGGGARYDRHADGAIDRIALRDGTLTIEASTATAPVVVSGKNVKVHAGTARLSARAEGGVVRQVEVFAGSVEIQTASGVVVVTAGESWSWDDDTTTARVAAFRAGWDALRAGDFATAATELERAEDDPGVGEDATYWAAIAWGRAGQTGRAIDGLTRFLDRFPGATRAGEAHLALARLITDADAARAHLEAAAKDADPRVRAAAEAALAAP